MLCEVERLRELLVRSPDGFSKEWADAGEDVTGDAYRELQRQYTNVVEAGEVVWGSAVFTGRVRDLPGEYPEEIRHRLRQARAKEVALWVSRDMFASVVLGSHDADTMRTVQVEYRRAGGRKGRAVIRWLRVLLVKLGSRTFR